MTMGMPGADPTVDDLPALDPAGDPGEAGPSMDQKLDEMLAMQQAIMALLEGAGAPPPEAPPMGGMPGVV